MISVNPDIVPDIVGDIVFLHDIGDFPISHPSRKGKSEISDPISRISTRGRVENPDIIMMISGQE